MKKILSIVALLAIGLVNAQDFKSSRGEYMLPEKGDWAIGFNTDGIFEYLGNSFNGNTNNNAPTVGYYNDFNGNFVGKYFTSDKSAYRVIFNLQLISASSKTSNTILDPSLTVVTVPVTPPANSITNTDNNIENSSFNTNFSIGLGKEWRRGKTRLQGFYGADILMIVTSGSSTLIQNTESNTTVTTPARTVKSINNVETKNKNGVGFGLGAQAFIGAEYFLFPKIAIGAQYTYGARMIFTGASKITTVTTNSTNDSTASPVFTSSESTVESNGAKNSNIGLTGVGIASINLTLHF